MGEYNPKTVKNTYKLNESDCHFKILDHQVLIGNPKLVLTRPDRMVYCMFAVADTILVVRACKKNKRDRKGLEWRGQVFSAWIFF